jgi:hypothetical protein
MLEYTLSVAVCARAATAYTSTLLGLAPEAALLPVPGGLKLDFVALALVLMLGALLAFGTKESAAFNTGALPRGALEIFTDMIKNSERLKRSARSSALHACLHLPPYWNCTVSIRTSTCNLSLKAALSRLQISRNNFKPTVAFMSVTSNMVRSSLQAGDVPNATQL